MIRAKKQQSSSSQRFKTKCIGQQTRRYSIDEAEDIQNELAKRANKNDINSKYDL